MWTRTEFEAAAAGQRRRRSWGIRRRERGGQPPTYGIQAFSFSKWLAPSHMIQVSFAVIFPFGNGKAIFYIISRKSLRLVPISLPLWQLVVHIQHSGLIEYVVSWFYYVPVLDSRVLITVQLSTPGAPFVDLRILTGNATTTLLASKASLPWFAGNLI